MNNRRVAQTAAQAGQKSHANRFDLGRGRSVRAARRAQILPLTVTRHGAIVMWADLVARRCGTREACAAMFSVTFQTACNWFDGFSIPTGDKVLQAIDWWPEEFGQDP